MKPESIKKLLPVRKSKALFFILLLALLFVALTVNVTSNNWKTSINQPIKVRESLNPAEKGIDNEKLILKKANIKFMKNNINEDFSKDNKFDKITYGLIRNNEAIINNNTNFDKYNVDDNDVENKARSVNDEYSDGSLESEFGNNNTGSVFMDEEKGDYSDDFSERVYEYDPDNKGDEWGVTNRGDSEGFGSSETLVNKDWVLALRANTKRAGILRKRNLHWTIEMEGNYSSELFMPPAEELPRQRLPRVIIFGVGHCGTRALLEFLKMHPYIVPSSIEIHFFDQDVNFVKGYQWYKAQMPLSYSNQLTLEKTPSYIWSERAMNEIYRTNRNVKLIAIMKDPVQRLVSMKHKRHAEYLNTIRLETVDGALQLTNNSMSLRHGRYVTYLKAWFQKFPRSQIHIIESSDFVKNPAREIDKIEAFLEIPRFLKEKSFYFNATKGYYCIRPLHMQTIECMKNSKGREHPNLDPVVEKLLYDYYRQSNEELYELLGRRFNWPA